MFALSPQITVRCFPPLNTVHHSQLQSQVIYATFGVLLVQAALSFFDHGLDLLSNAEQSANDVEGAVTKGLLPETRFRVRDSDPAALSSSSCSPPPPPPPPPPSPFVASSSTPSDMDATSTRATSAGLQVHFSSNHSMSSSSSSSYNNLESILEVPRSPGVVENGRRSYDED